jgi:hypothetical protein
VRDSTKIEVVDVWVAAGGVDHVLSAASIRFVLADLGHKVDTMVLDQYQSTAIDTGLGQHSVECRTCEAQHNEILQRVRRNATRAGEFPALEWIEKGCIEDAGSVSLDIRRRSSPRER